jgi:protocatechuate 3,4-dioxygenase beta subunit
MAKSTSSGPDASTLGCVVTPAETEGPYFVDELLRRSDLTSGTSRAGVLNGLPLLLQIGVYSVSGSACTPLSGAQVDIWHADSGGVYSDISAQRTVGEKFLRGYLLTDQTGMAQFTTIYPGWYPGRAVHIHFKVRIYSSSGAKTYEFTSQLFCDDSVTDTVFAGAPYNARGTRDTRNTSDSIYTAGGGGQKLMLALQRATSGSGYQGTFSIGLQLS